MGGATVLLVVLLLQQVGGFANLLDDPIMGADYLGAAEFVAQRHEPGEPVLVALPPPAYLAFGGADDVVFLAGKIESERAQRYTRRTDDGRYVDFWLGVPSIVSVDAVCAYLESVPSPWLVVDDDRLSWLYGGAMAETIRTRTVEVFRGDGGVSVRRPFPSGAGATLGEAACGQEIARVPIGHTAR